MTRHTVTRNSRFGPSREWETLPVINEFGPAREATIAPGVILLIAAFAAGTGAGFVGAIVLGAL